MPSIFAGTLTTKVLFFFVFHMSKHHLQHHWYPGKLTQDLSDSYSKLQLNHDLMVSLNWRYPLLVFNESTGAYMYFWLSDRNMVSWILPECCSLAQTGKTISCIFIRVERNSSWKTEGKTVFNHVMCVQVIQQRKNSCCSIPYILALSVLSLGPSLWALCESELSC